MRSPSLVPEVSKTEYDGHSLFKEGSLQVYTECSPVVQRADVMPGKN